MPHSRFNSGETGRIGQELYEQRIRAQVEIEENIGKLLSIDVETGDYEISDDQSLDAPLRLYQKHPDAAVFTLRIGYNAVYALGGVVERTS